MILIVAFAAILGFFSPTQVHAPAPVPAPVSTTQYVAPAVEVELVKELTIPEQIAAAADAAGIPATTMQAIAWCESHYRQFSAPGKPLRSKTADTGLFQINDIHKKELERRGMDVASSTEDNIDYAMELYKKNGTSDWNSSAHCWRPMLEDPGLIPKQ